MYAWGCSAQSPDAGVLCFNRGRELVASPVAGAVQHSTPVADGTSVSPAVSSHSPELQPGAAVKTIRNEYPNLVVRILVPGGGGRTPTRLPSADFESAFSTVAGARKRAHVGGIKLYMPDTCKAFSICIALQGEAPNTGAKYHQKYPRKTQRTCVPDPLKSGDTLGILLGSSALVGSADFWSAGGGERRVGSFPTCRTGISCTGQRGLSSQAERRNAR